MKASGTKLEKLPFQAEELEEAFIDGWLLSKALKK
jgi:hypothetical protein